MSSAGNLRLVVLIRLHEQLRAHVTQAHAAKMLSSHGALPFAPLRRTTEHASRVREEGNRSLLLVAMLAETLPNCPPRPARTCKTTILTEIRRFHTSACRLQLRRHLEHALMLTSRGTMAAKPICKLRTVASRTPECNSTLALRAPGSMNVVVERVAHSARAIGAARSATIAIIIPAHATMRCKPTSHATPTLFIWRHAMLTLGAPNLVILRCRRRRPKSL